MNQEKQPEALRLADEFKLCNEHDCLPSMNDIDSAAAELRRLHAQNTEQRAELVAEAARTAEEKLRADQMTEQHRMQCNISKSAVATLVGLGYTDQGGEQWTPPIGKAPDFNLLDAAHARIADLEAQLSAIGAGGVESLRKRECLHQITEPAPKGEKVYAALPEGSCAEEFVSGATVYEADDMRAFADATAAVRSIQPPAPAAVAVPTGPALAVEALDSAFQHLHWGNTSEAMKSVIQARAALASAPAQEHATQLAGQGQEPAAWLASYQDREGNEASYVTTHYALAVENDARGQPVPLYPAAPAQAHKDEQA